jgi:hypothetical protein
MGKDRTGNKEKDNKKAVRKQSHCTIGSYLPSDAHWMHDGGARASPLHCHSKKILKQPHAADFPDDF